MGDGGADSLVSTCFGSYACDGNDLVACRDGVPVERLHPCLDACSRGRCVASECQAVEADRTSFAGCFFYTFQPDNVLSDADLYGSLLVTNPGTTATTAYVERPQPETIGDTIWVAINQATIPPGGVHRFPVWESAVSDTGKTSGGAIRLRSDLPVTVAAIHSDDRDPTHTFSSGGTMVWPVQSLGSLYRAMTYPQSGAGGVADLAGGLGGAGRIAIVGTQPGTHLHIRPPAKAVLDAGGVSLDDVVLGEGDVFQLYSAGELSDLSGTEISAPDGISFAVFSGNMTTSYGLSAPGVHSPDMTHEQMPPVGAWSESYVAASLPPEANVCDPLLGPPGASVWRILGKVDGTVVSFDPPNVAGLPGATVPLSSGEVVDFVATSSFTITASYPILVTQGIDCEPSLSLAVSTERLLSDLLFAVLPGFEQVVAVVRQTGVPVLLDGKPIDEKLFRSAGTAFQVAQVLLPDCPPSALACPHRLTSARESFGATLRGMDALSSYALTVPTFRGCNTSDPDCQP